MIELTHRAKEYGNAERLAEDFLKEYFHGKPIQYPINPFQILKDTGVIFLLQRYSKLEGVYLPATGDGDYPMVGINADRPITRQRFTAAHELCHHLRDADKQTACPIGQKDKSEQFADHFAAALLMPLSELKKQVNRYRTNRTDYITFDNVLEISDYFGVSFEACLYRVAYRCHAISGDIDASALRKRIGQYRPDSKRKTLGMNYLPLYEGLVNAYADVLAFTPSENSKLVFTNNYIYNDSRMEGVQTSEEHAAEIVTDLRLNAQNSKYCLESNEAYLSVAGHYAMYQEIFKLPVKETCSVFDARKLNRCLFSYYPCPEYGGTFRQTDTLVLGAKFDTVSPNQIIPELIQVDREVQELLAKKKVLAVSEYIKAVVHIHHRLTVIHPFGDGNGRTLRAFMNVLLICGGVTPVYIKTSEKEMYLAALNKADTQGDYTELNECVIKCLLRSSVDLSEV
ncbi:MAG: ImmA/IrrE family metallo-endopeptidase [Clostridia bacterium]|nr:ImmA/IrrE family metallo-endopeptidase [Clostridia bacterium]